MTERSIELKAMEAQPLLSPKRSNTKKKQAKKKGNSNNNGKDSPRNMHNQQQAAGGERKRTLTEAEAKLLAASTQPASAAGAPSRFEQEWKNTPCYKAIAAHCWDKPRMTLADQMLLSPWQKWKKYNRVPWKIVLHSLIFIVVTTQARGSFPKGIAKSSFIINHWNIPSKVLLAYVETAQYTRATHNTFEALFIDNGRDFDEDVFGVRMHKVEDVLESLQNTVETVRYNPSLRSENLL